MKNYMTIISITISFIMVSCSYDITPPGIRSYSPSNGAVIEPSHPVIIRFSKSMTKDATQKAFTLLYGEYGDSSVAGNFSWENNDTVLIFYPKTPLKNGYHRIIIDKSAKDKHNNTLTTQHLSYFTVGQDIIPPEIISVHPSDCSENVPLNSTIIITFSESMNIASVLKNIRISPTVEYTSSWDNANTSITLVPHSPLMFNTWYKIELTSECLDSNNNPMIHPFNSIFRSGSEYIRPQITGLHTTSITQNMALGPNFSEYEGANIHDSITISFNEPIDTSTLLSALHFSPSISWLPTWENSNQTCTITFTQPLIVNTRYEIVLNSNLKDTAQNTLLNDFCVYFLTNGNNSLPPDIQHLKCINTVNGERQLAPRGFTSLGDEVTSQNNTYLFQIQFSNDLIRSTVPDNVKIEFVYGEEPDKIGHISRYEWKNGSRQLQLTITAVEGGNVYKLLLKGGNNGIASVNGVTLQNDEWYLFYFNPVD